MDTIKLPLLAIRSTLPGFSRSVPVVYAFAVDAQITGGEVGHGLRQQLVFDFQHACGQGVGGVGIVYGHGALGDDGATIELGGNEVYGAAREAAAFVDGALVGVRAGKGGQQGGMNIDGLIGEAAAKLGRENAHIAGKQHKVGRVAGHEFQHGLVEIGAAGEVFGIEGGGMDALLCRPGQPGGLGIVGEHGGDVQIGDIGLHHGLHIAAAAGNEDDGFGHGVII